MSPLRESGKSTGPDCCGYGLCRITTAPPKNTVPLTVLLRGALCRSEDCFAEGRSLFLKDFFGFSADPTAGAIFPYLLCMFR
jgi:hypothetical protein